MIFFVLKEMSAHECTTVVDPQHTEDISITDTRMKTNHWELSEKTVQKAWIDPRLGALSPGDLVLCRFERFMKVL